MDAKLPASQAANFVKVSVLPNRYLPRFNAYNITKQKSV